MAARRDDDRLTLEVHGAAIFSNFLGLKRQLDAIDDDVREVVIDFSDACVVDHTVLEKLHLVSNEWVSRTLRLDGLQEHQPRSPHHLAVRLKPRKRTAS